MLRETHRSRFSPALEVAGCGVGERPWSPLRVKMEVAALRREVCFANSRHSAKVAYGRFEARRPVEPAVEDRKRRLLDARRTSIEYQMAIRARSSARDMLGRQASSIAAIGVTGIVCSHLCCRRRVDAPREVRFALFQEGRKRLLCVFRADQRTKLFVLSLHCSLDLLTKWLLHEPLAGLQRFGRLRCQFPSRFGRLSSIVDVPVPW